MVKVAAVFPCGTCEHYRGGRCRNDYSKFRGKLRTAEQTCPDWEELVGHRLPLTDTDAHTEGSDGMDEKHESDSHAAHLELHERLTREGAAAKTGGDIATMARELDDLVAELEGVDREMAELLKRKAELKGMLPEKRDALLRLIKSAGTMRGKPQVSEKGAKIGRRSVEREKRTAALRAKFKGGMFSTGEMAACLGLELKSLWGKYITRAMQSGELVQVKTGLYKLAEVEK